jgi:thymidylate synthase
MPISLIACVCIYKNKLAIGSNGNLLFKIKEDQQFFKNITTNSLGIESKIPNIVLMGRKTYDSIPGCGLHNIINFVLTNHKNKWVKLPLKLENLDKHFVYYINLEMFYNFYSKNKNSNVFVIGGSNIYNIFLKNIELNKLYITHIERDDDKLIKFEQNKEPDTFMDNFLFKFKLTSYSEKYTKIIKEVKYKARTLYYIRDTNALDIFYSGGEFQYLNLMNRILKEGNERSDRTGTGTISLFGTSMRFDISQSIPLLTTKKVPFKTIVKELLWILQGNTDAKILQQQGVHIWDGNTSREFLDKQNLQHYPEGVLGAGYGWQLRHQGANYSSSLSDISKTDRFQIGGFDQLIYIEKLLKTDPFSRRIMFSYWNPSDFVKTALQPCHVLVQFYVTEENNQKYLSCQFYMRSNDFDTASCYNICSYSILTYILAKRCGMLPKEIIYTVGDCHIYKNHIEQVKEQLTRTPRPFPKLKLDDSIINTDWQYITCDNFELIGYFPDKYIKIDMAI